MERLDKFLAHAGAGTRAEVKKYIKGGRVRVNGQIEKSAERKVDPSMDEICLDERILTLEQFEYHMLYKPQGCVTATKDAKDATVMDFILSARKEKLFPVGRLDKDTEGLLLITDDGELAHKLLAPKKHVDKTYFARVKGRILPEHAVLFEAGLDIGDEKKTLPAVLEILQTSEETSEVLIKISEGRYHQIKRMFHTIGSEVLFLKRLSMGSLCLDETLQPGESRLLTKEEKETLLALK